LTTKRPSEGDLVFIAGHPNLTERRDTLSQLKTQRDVVIPAINEYLVQRLAGLRYFAGRGAEETRLTASLIFVLGNSLKINNGKAAALADVGFWDRKQAEEGALRESVKESKELTNSYQNVWDVIEQIEQERRRKFRFLIFRRTDSQLFDLALQIVQYAREKALPETERSAAFRGQSLQATRSRLLSNLSFETELEVLNMSNALELGERKLGAEDPFVHGILQGGVPAGTVKRLISDTRLADAAYRKVLIDGSLAAVSASNDPLIGAARRVEQTVRRDEDMQESIVGPLEDATEKLGRIRYLAFGETNYPDATSSLRFSYGTISGYSYNGAFAPPFTTFHGLYDRSAGFQNRSPYELSRAETSERESLDLATPLNFVCTCEIVPGFSGGPVVNRQGELIGVVFDGNIESLGSTYRYNGKTSRAVAVQSAGIVEGLRRLYGADALVREIKSAGVPR
jgi:hypothetical protein